MKNKLIGKFEIGDRAWIILCHINEALVDHPALSERDAKELDKAQKYLYNIYQRNIQKASEE